MTTEQLQFRPRARIIRAIGDQLISGPEAAVIELVKNAYDADATQVMIVFWPPLKSGEGRLTVTDDGHGMDLTDIQDRWMEPATSEKARSRKSRSGARQMMGSKGIGRFAAAKLGARMIMRSVTGDAPPRREFIVGEIDWSDFSGDAYLADISIDLLGQDTHGPTGTEIEILGLTDGWNKDRLERLVQELRRLVSPLDAAQRDDTFKIFLDLDRISKAGSGFDGHALVNPSGGDPDREPNEIVPFPLLTACDYEVSGAFDSAGHFTGTMQIRRAGRAAEPLELDIPRLDDEEDCGPVGVKFFIFDRETDALKRNMADAGAGSLTAAQARAMLDQVAGIAVYRDGFRVRPYGDLGTDWLTLDKERVQNPSMRLGANQIAGYVTVDGQGDSNLVERSSREGFEENGAYRRLRRLLKTLLAEKVEPKRSTFRDDAGIMRRQTTTFSEVRELAGLAKIRTLIGKLDPENRARAEAVIDRESTLLGARIDALEERQRLLEAKSSLGNIVGEILHEGVPPAGYIATTSGRLQRLWLDIIRGGDAGDSAKQEFPKKLHLMRENGLRLSSLFELLRPLAGGKRGAPKFFRVHGTIDGARELFLPSGVAIQVSGALDAPEVIGYPEDLSTALVNLLKNAVHWLEQSATPNPRIDIKVTSSPALVEISVMDNGPGVPAEFVDKIFDVGFTLRSEGTGLGLNIAREALDRSQARLAFDPEYEGGARFLILFDRETRNA